MTFLAPWYFIAACGAAAALVALHFLVTREPRTSVFPTVRFVPQAQVRSFALALKLTDIPLLLLRVAAVLLIGAALAQPRIAPLREKVARIAAVDSSRAVARNAQWRAMVERYATDADAIVVFDSHASEVSPEELDRLLATRSGGADTGGEPGSLSAGLIASLRAASRLRDRADAVEIVLISPLAAEEDDAATMSIRKLWAGGITVVHAPSVRDAARDVTPSSTGASEPRIERADSTESSSWIARTPAETIGGIRAGDAMLIYPFERRWRLKQPPEPGTRVIARWIDGEPAAIERAAGREGACVRSIGFAVPKIGDSALRPDFVRFVTSLQAPCGEIPDFTTLPAQFIAALRGTGRPAPASSIAPELIRTTPLVPWLLAAALALLALEYPLRRLGAPSQGRGRAVEQTRPAISPRAVARS